MSGFRSLQRQEMILELLARQQHSSVQELADLLHVSPWTVRRDVAELEAQALVQRFHGGVRIVPGVAERAPAGAAADRRAAKQRIGEAAAAFVRNGRHIALGAGSTTTAVAQALRGKHKQLTVVTNGLNIALELAAEPLLQVVCTGGDVHGHYDTLTGPVTERALKAHFYDTAFIGVSGIAAPEGLTVDSRLDAAALQLMIEHARRIIVVADSSKFGQVCFAHLAPLSATHMLITDAQPPIRLARDLAEAGVEVIVAPAQG